MFFVLLVLGAVRIFSGTRKQDSPVVQTPVSKPDAVRQPAHTTSTPLEKRIAQDSSEVTVLPGTGDSRTLDQPNEANSAFLPTGYSIPPITVSPDGRFGVSAPDFARFDENAGPQNQLVDIRNKRVISTIISDTWIEEEGKVRNHMSLDPYWSKDGSVLGWVLGGKWGPIAFVMLKVEAPPSWKADAVSSVLWQVDVLKSAKGEIVARTRTAVPVNYEAAKNRNRGNGSAYPDGFTIDVETPQESFYLPLKFNVTLTSNPKQIPDVPPEANVQASMDAVIDQDAKLTFSNYRAEVGGSPGVDPVPASSDTKERVLSFVAAFQAAEAADGLQVNIGKYADKVDYFGNGSVDRDFIEKDKRAYFERWPSRKQVMTGPIQAAKLDYGWSVSYLTHFRVEGRDGDWAEGDGEHTLHVIPSAESYKVSLEKVQVKNYAKGGAKMSSAAQGQVLSGERYPETRTRNLTPEEIQDWSVEKLRYAINEMYARHGADFKDMDIRKWFSQFSWYTPSVGKTYDLAEAEFSAIEAANVKLLGTTRQSLSKSPDTKANANRSPSGRPKRGSLREKTEALDNL
jgi:hypothetical protein